MSSSAEPQQQQTENSSSDTTTATKSSSSTDQVKKEENSGGSNNNNNNNSSKEASMMGPAPTLDVQLPAVIGQMSNSPLEYAYSFWFSKRPSKGQTSMGGGGGGGPSGPQAYDANLRLVGTFNTVEKFWFLYSHMCRPQDLQGHADIHMFKAGIRPLWEDDTNKNGGKWIVRLKKGLSTRCWENLILAILGEQFMVGEEICGAVVSIRYQEDLISIWNKTCSNQAVTSRIKDTLKRILNLPPSTILEYKSHNDSLKDHSSFRNTFCVDK